MRGIRMSVAAAVATGLVVLAVAALDAVGADKGNAKESGVAQLVQCLRDRGVAVPSLSGAALERWFPRNVPDADGRACKAAVAASMGPPEKRAAAAVSVDKIVACLRAKGFDPPTDPVALKRWIGGHADAAKACAVGPEPDCGAAKEEEQ